MLGRTCSFMIMISFFAALATGNLKDLGIEFASSLNEGVNLCLSLLGMMCFWSGLMRVLRDAGALKVVSKLMMPVMKIIYGKSALEEQTAENLSASIAANFLGLGNASLPLGINAVKSLERNNKSSSASDGTIMFTVLATVPFQLIPSTLIALRTKYGAVNPFDVVPYIWMCSAIITVFAVLVCKVLSKLWR